MGTLWGPMGFEGSRSPPVLARRVQLRPHRLPHTAQPAVSAELGIFETRVGVVASGTISHTERSRYHPRRDGPNGGLGDVTGIPAV